MVNNLKYKKSKISIFLQKSSVIFFLSTVITISNLNFVCAKSNITFEGKTVNYNQSSSIIPINQGNKKKTIASSKHYHDKAVILYEQNVGNLSNEEVDKLWPSNNPRTWILTGTMDGEIPKRYKAWSNRYKCQVKGTTDERGLEEDTDLTIYIKNLNIKASSYHDIRLVLDYLSNNSNTSLTHSYSMEMYAIDEKNYKYGPFNVADFETTGFYMRKEGERQIYERNFNIISESIIVPRYVTIKELILKPYGNYPRKRDSQKTVVGDWRGADATLFEIAGIKVLGYKSGIYQKPDYVKTSFINVDEIREKTVQRMYDLATVKWNPDFDFHDTRVIGSNPNLHRATYHANAVYYGPPYTQRNRVPIETFSNSLKGGRMPKPEKIQQVRGADCASSVTYPISKFIPMHVIYNTTDFIWDRNKTTLLGNLTIDGKEASTELLKEKFSEQDYYEAYAKLQKGDIVSTHYKRNTHVRLVSGNTHVIRKNDGSINPEASYFIITEISSVPADTTDKNNYGGDINENDYVVPFIPMKKYTDIKTLSEIAGKNTNFRINKKITFKQAYNNCYVPLTLNVYLTATVDEPYAKIINPNTIYNIGNGCKGTIVSNSTILRININIKNNVTGENKSFVVYPDHNTGTLEGMYGNTFSLYYNTPKYIQDYLKNTLQNNRLFEVTINVTAGKKENIKVLHLQSHKEP